MSDTPGTVEVMLIAAKEAIRPLPIVGQILSTIDQLSLAVEANRVGRVLQEVETRLEVLEKRCERMLVLGVNANSVLVYGCEQARSDVLCDEKSREYARVMAHYMVEADAKMSDIVEVLDALKKLNSGDIQLLFQFRNGPDGIHPARMVTTLAGYQEGVDPFRDQRIIRERMELVFPTLMRLQGFGMLYLSMEIQSGGSMLLDVGGLSYELRKTVFLTNSGKRLLAALSD